MELKTTFKFYNDNDAPYFGGYKNGSITNGEPTLMFCMDAVLSVIKDDTDKAESFKDIALATLTHEFCHSMQEWLGKEFDELEVEKILGAYNEKWNVFNAEEPEGQETASFAIYDLLDWMDGTVPLDTRSDDYKEGVNDFKEELKKIFAPMVLWHEANKKDADEKALK